MTSSPDYRQIKGLYVCTHCDNAEVREREVRCWSCGDGEMVWVSRERLNIALKKAWRDIFPKASNDVW